MGMGERRRGGRGHRHRHHHNHRHNFHNHHHHIRHHVRRNHVSTVVGGLAVATMRSGPSVPGTEKRRTFLAISMRIGIVVGMMGISLLIYGAIGVSSLIYVGMCCLIVSSMLFAAAYGVYQQLKALDIQSTSDPNATNVPPGQTIVTLSNNETPIAPQFNNPPPSVFTGTSAPFVPNVAATGVYYNQPFTGAPPQPFVPNVAPTGVYYNQPFTGGPSQPGGLSWPSIPHDVPPNYGFQITTPSTVDNSTTIQDIADEPPPPSYEEVVHDGPHNV